LILPLFNKFEPIEEGDLRSAVERYTCSQKFKMHGVFTMDGSMGSTKSNPFFTGFGRFRRIVPLDTLLERRTVEEVICMLAHEMGPYKNEHVLKGLALFSPSQAVLTR